MIGVCVCVCVCVWQIRLDNGRLIYAPVDNNSTIRTFESDPLVMSQREILERLDEFYDFHDWKNICLIKEQVRTRVHAHAHIRTRAHAHIRTHARTKILH